ncbi:reverse transcriptase domain-containing protein [Tanacetum coccineum]
MEAMYHLVLQTHAIILLVQSSDSSPIHSSGLDAPDQAHSGSSTRDVSPRLCPRLILYRHLHQLRDHWLPYQCDILPPYRPEVSTVAFDVGECMRHVEKDFFMILWPCDGFVLVIEEIRIDLDDAVGEPPGGVCEVRRDRDDTQRILRRIESNGNKNGNGNGNGNNGGDNGDGNENHDVNRRGDRLVARECTYQDFMKCQPLSFKGTEGVVGLIRWSEKMKTMFYISNCPKKYQVKYATCTLLDSALTWWNSHKRTIRTDAAYALSWRELMKLMTEVYCPRNEIQKMETELWNLSVKNNDIANYTQRFQELTMMCTKMVPKEEDQVEKFIGGLPYNIQGNVIAAEPTRLQDAVRIANNLMDQKLKGYAVRNAENKRRLDNNYGNNRGQQPPHKRQNTGGQNVARAYVAGNNEKREYEGTFPLCNKCKLHHVGPCTVRCGKCNRVGHLPINCRVTNPTTPTQRGQIVNQEGVDLFECGAQGHYWNDCPKIKNQNRGKSAYWTRNCARND